MNNYLCHFNTKMMKFFRSLISNKKLLISIIVGLAIASLFYKITCEGGRCLVVRKKPRLGVESNVHMDTDGTCYRFDREDTYCQLPDEKNNGDLIPAGGYQDPGYGSGQGSISATYEGFTASCLGRDLAGTEYPNNESKFIQMACKPEPKWNLPRDARIYHQPKYPCGVPGQCEEASCNKHHPMDTVFSPPNEGLLMKQIRN